MVDNFALVLTHALLALAAWRLLLSDGLGHDPEDKPKGKARGKSGSVKPGPEGSGDA